MSPHKTPRRRGKKRRDPERWWNEVLMPMIVKRYEQETGRKWVAGSSEVKEWIDKTFNKDKQP